MAKSTTIVRDDNKSSGRLAERVQENAGQGNQLTGMFTRTGGLSSGCAQRNAEGDHSVAGRSTNHHDGRHRNRVCLCCLFLCCGCCLEPGHSVDAALAGRGTVVLKEKLEKTMTEEANPGEPVAPEEGLTPSANERFKWYIIHAYSGFERKVKESIEGRVEAFGLQNRIGRVMIPTEPVTEIFNGKKRTVERVFLPGYVLVEMDLDNDLWHVMKNTPRVTGFLGTGDKPVALSEQEVSSILFRTDVSKDKPRMKIKFEKNESVRITDGPFANFNGVVDEVNEDRETLKVMVTIFGRSTPVELEFGKVEKVV